jgi:hypothetical protein
MKMHVRMGILIGFASCNRKYRHAEKVQVVQVPFEQVGHLPFL